MMAHSTPPPFRGHLISPTPRRDALPLRQLGCRLRLGPLNLHHNPLNDKPSSLYHRHPPQLSRLGESRRRLFKSYRFRITRTSRCKINDCLRRQLLFGTANCKSSDGAATELRNAWPGKSAPRRGSDDSR